MENQRTTGLTKRGGIWHIDKVFRGTRIRESTATGDLAEAQEQLAWRIDQIRIARIYGVRPDRTFRAAATKFLEENPTQEDDPRRRPSGEAAGSLNRQSDAAAGAHGQPATVYREAAKGRSEVALDQ